MFWLNLSLSLCLCLCVFVSTVGFPVILDLLWICNFCFTFYLHSKKSFNKKSHRQTSSLPCHRIFWLVFDQLWCNTPSLTPNSHSMYIVWSLFSCIDFYVKLLFGLFRFVNQIVIIRNLLLANIESTKHIFNISNIVCIKRIHSNETEGLWFRRCFVEYRWVCFWLWLIVKYW